MCLTVTSFNNVGLSPYSENLVPFNDDPFVLTILSFSILLGTASSR